MRTMFNGRRSEPDGLPVAFHAVGREPKGCRTRSRKILEFKHYCADPPV